MTKNAQLVIDLFQTKLGWLGLTWQDTAVSSLTFGHATRESAVNKLNRLAAGATTRMGRSDSNAEQKALRNRLKQYAAGEFQNFSDVDLDLSWTTDFQLAVITACRNVGWGETATYGDLAELAGSPRAARAVGSVMSGNRFPIIIPCHRIVSSTGNRWGGFTAPGGVPMKKRMLRLEQQVVAS